MSRRKRTLLQLEADLLGRSGTAKKAGAPGPRLSQAKAYDHGGPISASFGSAGRAPCRTNGADYLALSVPTAIAPQLGTGDAFRVEPFEALQPSLPAPRVPAVAEPRMPAPIPTPPPPVTPPAADEIDDDLKAISRRHPETPIAPGPPAPLPLPPPAPAAAVAPAAPPAPDPHLIFEQMGRAMRAPMTFDLGAMDVSRQLDALELDLAAEEAAEARKTPAERDGPDLTETEEDIRTIGALRKVKPPVPERVSSPQPAVVMPATPVHHDVPFISSTEQLAAAPAAAAMVIAWRDKLPADAAAVSEGREGWSRYREAVTVTGDEFFRRWGLSRGEGREHTFDVVRALLVAHGPLWFGSPDARGAARVIAGLSEGPLEPNARVQVMDPSGMPSASRTISFTECFTLPPGGTGWILAWSESPPPAG